MKKKNEADKFNRIVSGKKLPILTLDEKWHAIFQHFDKTPKIKELESQLNHLLKKQGKLVTEIKGMRALKPKLMNGIIKNMDHGNSGDSVIKEKALDKNQKLMKEIGSKLTSAEDSLTKIPYDIKSVNERLMLESAKVCYQKLYENKKKITAYDEWILKTRNELKERLIEKQEMESSNDLMYSYMHDLLGADMLELLDKDLGKL